MQKRKTFIAWIAGIVIVLGGGAYLLADRYLIEHVEIEQAVAIATQTPAAVLVSNSYSLSVQPTAAPEVITADDWHYSDSSVSISIEKVTSGSGKDTLTYFVADVLLIDATDLSSAFAKNQYGQNIIDYTSEIAAQNSAIFAVNGDYYGFRDNGIIIRNGVLYRDEPARIGLAFYSDGSMKIYDETQTTGQAQLEEGVWNTLSFGPALIEDSQIVTNSGRVQVDTNVGNHSIQGNQPRTGVGIIANNHYIFVVVDGRSSGYSRGASLAEFAQIFADLGCSDAYNLDGGGSSTMYFMGRVVNNPLGKNRERGTSDILFIGS